MNDYPIYIVESLLDDFNETDIDETDYIEIDSYSDEYEHDVHSAQRYLKNIQLDVYRCWLIICGYVKDDDFPLQKFHRDVYDLIDSSFMESALLASPTTDEKEESHDYTYPLPETCKVNKLVQTMVYFQKFRMMSENVFKKFITSLHDRLYGLLRSYGCRKCMLTYTLFSYDGDNKPLSETPIICVSFDNIFIPKDWKIPQLYNHAVLENADEVDKSIYPYDADAHCLDRKNTSFMKNVAVYGNRLAHSKYNLDIKVNLQYYRKEDDKTARNRNGFAVLTVTSTDSQDEYEYSDFLDFIKECIIENIDYVIYQYRQIVYIVKTPLKLGRVSRTNNDFTFYAPHILKSKPLINDSMNYLPFVYITDMAGKPLDKYDSFNDNNVPLYKEMYIGELVRTKQAELNKL